MKTWSVKSMVYSLESSMINLFNPQFINQTCRYSLRHLVSYIPTCCINYLWKIPKSQYLKKKKRQTKRKRFKLTGKFQVETKYQKLCYEFRAFVRCIEAPFYRPDYQKFLICPFIKILGYHLSEPLNRSTDLLKHSAEYLRALTGN